MTASTHRQWREGRRRGRTATKTTVTAEILEQGPTYREAGDKSTNSKHQLAPTAFESREDIWNLSTQKSYVYFYAGDRSLCKPQESAQILSYGTQNR